jgi:hypothetical protein
MQMPVRIVTGSTTDITVELNGDIDSNRMPDTVAGRVMDYGDSFGTLAVRDQDVTMWFNQNDGYRLKMDGPQADSFTAVHLRINPASGKPGFNR